MASVFSWIKKQIGYLLHSIPEFIKAVILFILIISGLGISILLRLAGQHYVTIIVVGTIIEVFALIAVYLFLKNYLKTEEESKPIEKRRK